MAPASDKHYQARVLERRDVSGDLWVIRVDPGGPFRFVAGQYATLGVDHGQKRIERAYSIVSSPHETSLEFFFELVPQGELTPHLYKLQVGEELTCRRIAKGRFTLDLQSGHIHHLLLATVTGIAPYVSYVRTLHRDWQNGAMPGNHRLYVIHGASRSWEFAYREELAGLAAAVPWLTYLPTISRPWEDAAWKGETGRVEDVIRKYADSWGLAPGETTAYLCGHPEMIEHGRGILLRRGWDKRHMRDEVYFVPGKEPAAE